MKLVCPACGATASRECWENDAAARQFEGLIVTLHPLIQPHVTRYIGMFRKGDRGLAWKRALRLLGEVKAMIDAGTIQWDGGETRPAPVTLWAEVMEGMLDRGLKELDNHNYLRKVVWDKARGQAARAEAATEERRRHAIREPEKVSEEESAQVKDMFQAFKSDPRAFLEKERGGRKKED